MAKHLNVVHRRMVRQAMASAIPLERKIPVRPAAEAGSAEELIGEIPRADQQAPCKEWHTG